MAVQHALSDAAAPLPPTPKHPRLANPPIGDIQWCAQVQALVDRHAPAFAAAGVTLSLQRAQQSYWIQADVHPPMLVTGQPGARCSEQAADVAHASSSMHASWCMRMCPCWCCAPAQCFP
jgi:hypothetical protein